MVFDTRPHETVPLLPPSAASRELSLAPQASSGGARLPRKVSLTDVEKFFLCALLLDSSSSSNTTQQLHHSYRTNNLDRLNCDNPQQINYASTSNICCKKSLDENVLFQVPFSSSDGVSLEQRNSKFRQQLWQAHQIGAHSAIMKRASSHLRGRSSSRLTLSGRSATASESQLTPGGVGGFSQAYQQQAFQQQGSRVGMSFGGSSFGNYDSGCFSRGSLASSTTTAMTARSDMEINPPRQHDEESSWGEKDGGFEHYNTWEVLNDEYAEDFGFDFNETMYSIANALDPDEDDDCQPHVFKILGTSVDDVSAQPHVLSPPLMDSLLNFVPESMTMENFWLKYSMIRDGADLYTLKQYVKATPYTILAIETTKGDVFGAFCSHTWKTHPTFFGCAPAFLWRMRSNRQTPCHSLFDQAQMESEIDVYTYSGLNDLVQVCDEHRLAIGGGKLTPDEADLSAGGGDGSGSGLLNNGGITLASLDGQNFGFGIALDENLRSGTTSPCGTFRNPCLVNHMSKGEVFEVANLEVWTFTPCMDVESAERMEMTRFFVEEQIRTSSVYASNTGNSNSVYESNPFLSQAEFQRDFYRRVGHNQPSSTGGHQRKPSYEHSYVMLG